MHQTLLRKTELQLLLWSFTELFQPSISLENRRPAVPAKQNKTNIPQAV